jgi:hypothetical protein
VTPTVLDASDSTRIPRQLVFAVAQAEEFSLKLSLVA